MPTMFAVEQPMYGYRFGKKKQLLPVANEQAVIAQARSLRSTGLSLRKIAGVLAAKKKLSRAGTAFQAGQVKRMITHQKPAPKNGMTPKPCSKCGEAFTPRNPWQRFCCSEKRRQQQLSAGRKAARSGLKVLPVQPVSIFERDGWKCQLCGKPTPRAKMGTLSADAPALNHVKPLSRGGSHTPKNLRCACRSCVSKHGRNQVKKAA